MDKYIKQMIFAIAGFLLSIGFISDLLDSHSWKHALLFSGELLAMGLGLMLLVFFWVWLSGKLFK